MLAEQPKPASFKGGLEARRLQAWHVDLLHSIKAEDIWLACDTEAALTHLERAGDLLADFKIGQKRCFVMIGFDGESLADAERRLAKNWSRPAIYRSLMKGKAA